jgi:hypothetical protein
MERSKFENMAEASLRKYAAYVETALEGKRIWSDVNDFYQTMTYGNYGSDSALIRKIISPVGGLSRMDIEYLFYVIVNNDLDEEGSLDRPSVENTTVEFVYDEKVYRRIRRRGVITSYLGGSDLSNSYVSSLKEEDVIDPWQWNQTDEREDGWDILDYWFDI